MAVPARRVSKTRKRMRRTHLKKVAETTTLCPKCGAAIKPHRACTKCGYYKGKDVLGMENKEEVKVEEKASKKESKKENK